MSRILPILGFGLTIVVGGFYWATWDACRGYLDSIVINDAYYTLMRHIWAWIPAILLIVAIMCLVLAGVRHNETKREGY